jgi:GAF domain-containing protein
MGNAGTGGQMVTPPDETTADPYAVIATLRAERDAALAEKAELAKALAGRTAELVERNTEYSERIDHQSATIEVLKAMSASPDDTQPVFDLITRSAQELCDSDAAAIFEFDGELVHFRSAVGGSDNPDAYARFAAAFPMVPTRGSIPCRAILDKRVIHIRDMDADPDVLQVVRNVGVKSVLGVPLLRDDVSIGAFAINTRRPGGFTDNQVALLQTFAEQAVIAVTSAETYRALQGRTSDLQEALEQQTATTDVLRTINASPGELLPVFNAIPNGRIACATLMVVSCTPSMARMSA